MGIFGASEDWINQQLKLLVAEINQLRQDEKNDMAILTENMIKMQQESQSLRNELVERTKAITSLSELIMTQKEEILIVNTKVSSLESKDKEIENKISLLKESTQLLTSIAGGLKKEIEAVESEKPRAIPDEAKEATEYLDEEAYKEDAEVPKAWCSKCKAFKNMSPNSIKVMAQTGAEEYYKGNCIDCKKVLFTPLIKTN